MSGDIVQVSKGGDNVLDFPIHIPKVRFIPLSCNIVHDKLLFI
jgi:hypothetical protein